MIRTPTAPQITGPSAEAWTRVADVNRALFEACIQNAAACGDTGSFEVSAQWCSVAAWSAVGRGWFGGLSSPELEAQLLRAARQLPAPAEKTAGRLRPRWLHVLTEAYATLGHTNLCRRWIQYDRDAVHDIILLNQKGAVPANLAQAVEQSGGKCVVLDSQTPLLQRAADLRAYAWENSDVVLLHTHPEEVLATIAFGIEGGPPIILLNHADHGFWVGCAVSDLVVDIRPSGNAWTTQIRGVPRTVMLPIPLARENDSAGDASIERDTRYELRKSFGVPDDAVLFLTVGSPAKYRPMAGLDFVATALQIIRRSGDAYLIAVGPRDEGSWRVARQESGDRIRAVGHQPDSTRFCRASDVYLEGFPAGSLTAFLEAGQTGLACVRAPGDCTPPFSSDGTSVQSLAQPEDVAAYVEAAVALAANGQARAELGRQLRRAICAGHCEVGWLNGLSALKSAIPARHRVYPDFSAAQVSDRARNWYLTYLHLDSRPQSAVDAVIDLYAEAWKRTGTRPQLDRPVWEHLTESSNGAVDFDRATLRQLNGRIRARGAARELTSGAADALNKGMYAQGRKFIYRSVFTSPACVTDIDWLKLFVKLHVGRGWVAQCRRFIR
jgi:glycosyltransferase involved in cell wall biosynthesis